MRLLGHMVTRNEADRFLDRSLASLLGLCDQAAVFDDQSTDGTLDIITDFADHAPTVVRYARRADDEPSFADSEGRFRDVAWQYMEAVLRPEEGDWILALDADEIVVADDNLTEHLTTSQADALNVKIHELWKLDPPMERVDGYWGTITGIRLYRWRPGQHITHHTLASGSVPPVSRLSAGFTNTMSIFHLGYVRAADREAKHRRYVNQRGHNRTHVASILRRPTLQPLTGGL